MTYGATLRAARERAGLTQAELARRAGVAPNTVARLERGEMEPRPATKAVLDSALRRLGITVHKEESC